MNRVLVRKSIAASLAGLIGSCLTTSCTIESSGFELDLDARCNGLEWDCDEGWFDFDWDGCLGLDLDCDDDCDD